MRTALLLFCLLFCGSPVLALELAGVNLADTLEGADGAQLSLNGAGVRSKFVFKIYVAGLYLQQPADKVSTVLEPDAQKHIVMHFVYDKVEKEKLVDAWNEGFAANLGDGARQELAPSIATFNAMFDTVVKGDTIVLAYVPGKGTSVTVAGKEKGVVEGKPFNDALLSIWLGQKPVTAELKSALLGGKG